LSSPAANSPHHPLLQDEVRTSTLVGHHLPVSALLPLPDVDPPFLATADPRETLIHTGPDLSQDPALRDATEPVQDPFLLVLDPHQEDEEDAGTALVAMEAEEEGARVIAAIAVMTIGAGAEAVDGVAVADVRGEVHLILQRWSLG
jgi:hypothetical protein